MSQLPLAALRILDSSLVKISVCSIFLLFVRSLMLWIFPCIPWCFHLLHVISCISIWNILQTSLWVLILHPRHHYSWTSALLPFLLGYFFIVGRFYINDITQQCHIIALCLRPLLYLKVSSYYSSSWIISRTVVTCSLEQVSSFFSCRRLYRSFLQVKCISCMVRNIS